MDYPRIPGTSRIPQSMIAPLPLDEPLPPALTSPVPPSAGSKSLFAFWHSGISTLPPYLLRNILAWYRRYSPLGWTVYVLDKVEGSTLNVSRYIDTSSPSVVPAAFTNSEIEGSFVGQHTSDLVRFPLLLKYGGMYLDVGTLQFGDLNWLWEQVVSNPESPYDFAGFRIGRPPNVWIMNFAMMCGPGNPLVLRAHKILLKLWEGKTTTIGMHKHPLLAHVPMMRGAVPSKVVVKGEAIIEGSLMTDYAIQIQAMGAAQRWVDLEDCWDGPKYVHEKTWLIDIIEHGFVPDYITGWNGQRQFELLSLKLPESLDSVQNEEQKLARELVERTVGGSWCLKLSHGISGKLFGETLGMLWRRYDGSDCVEGTYGGWIRWAQENCKQDNPTKPMEMPVYEPTMVGRLADHL